MNDPVLSKLEAIHPTNAMSESYRNKVSTLLPLMNIVPRIVSGEIMQNVDDEWRRLPTLINQVDMTLPPDEFWAGICAFEDFKNVAKFALDLLCLPHSNADCERCFSSVNLIKTKIRNRLSNETLNGTLLAKQHIKRYGCCVDFSPTREMLNNMNSKTLYGDK